MRRSLYLLCILFLVPALSNAQFPASDPFTTTTGPLSTSNWTCLKVGVLTSTIQQNAGVLSATGGNGYDPKGACLWKAHTFSGSQLAQFVIGPDTIYSSASSPLVFFNTAGNGYSWDYTSGYIQVWAGGVKTAHSPSGICPSYSSMNAGDTIRLIGDSVSHTITCMDVTTEASGSWVDSTYSKGAPGVMIGTYAGHLKVSGPFVADCYPHSCNSPSPNLASGHYPSLQAISLGANTGWAIVYTTDGSTPTASDGAATHGAVYAGSVPLPANTITTVKALATKSGQPNSAVNSFQYAVGDIAPSAGGCQLFPSNSIFNTRIDSLPASPTLTASFVPIYGGVTLHHDFFQGPVGGNSGGIPYNIGVSTDPTYSLKFLYGDDSDRGPYHISDTSHIENTPGRGCQKTPGGNTDYHLLTVVVGPGNSCHLEELYQASCTSGTPNVWAADSGAIWDLRSNALRKNGLTSADAAGLPIAPLLLKYDEVASGTVQHALRMTFKKTNQSILWPARHQASNAWCSNPPNCSFPSMGLRIRLKADFDISGFSKTNQVILTAMKQYGIFNADNGNTGYFQGVSDPRWVGSDLDKLNAIALSNFEAVDESSLIVKPDSAQAVQPGKSRP
jgi:hypothetical protein